jgi:RNA polymerase sigma factor (TIGR02999 family)
MSLGKSVSKEAGGAPAGMARSGCELTDAGYRELQRIANQHLRNRFGKAAEGLTWQPTALVNETLLRIIKQRKRYDSQAHFFATANAAMKNVLVSYVRARQAQKRGGAQSRLYFDPQAHAFPERDDENGLDVEALFGALDHLATLDARRAEVAKLRVVWGLSIEEIVASLELSQATVERDWKFARAWLKRELGNRDIS